MREERAHLAASRAALARMRDTARHRVATGEAVAGDRYTAETLGRMLKSYAKELNEEPDGPLYFGRVRFRIGPEAGDHRGQTYRIGRRHIADEAGEPLVIDWRAPVSRSFYRACARDPLGVAQRRRYGWSTRGELTGYEDEDLDQARRPDRSAGSCPEEIERPRVGPMRDIVATIQPEQDDLVRAGLDSSVCVQGAPGTGKTAVGLHRAAYLLYTHRQRLKATGVLVIGPNPAFLRYISAVLPMLGEVDVEQRTLEDLLDERPATAVDTPAAAAVKHDIRMAEVIARALDRAGARTGRAAGRRRRIRPVAGVGRRAAAAGRRGPARGPALRARSGTAPAPHRRRCCSGRPSARAAPAPTGTGGWAAPTGPGGPGPRVAAGPAGPTWSPTCWRDPPALARPPTAS